MAEYHPFAGHPGFERGREAACFAELETLVFQPYAAFF
jgi:hypothetical protein